VVCDPGQPPEDGTGIFGVHLLTPQDEHTTLYHFTSVRKGPQYVAPEDLDEVRRKLSELRRYAFEEQDAPMIAGQHEILAQRRRNGQSVQPVLLNIDAGPLRARRLLEGLIGAEGSRAGEAASA
jgi:vanillate O-demethylase monooxygenase subunit